MMSILQEAESLFTYTQSLRRDFHRHPELGFKEFRTASIVAQELRKLTLDVTTGVGETGVVTTIEGASPGEVALLRFDMDALPITEQTGAEYASENPGVMHACGHDAHTAIGLTVARLLHAHRQEIHGSVKLVFQPAEEGMGGAEKMIEQGVLENPRPNFTLALHMWNERPVGWIGVTSGPAMAAAEIFHMRITGKGGHGAVPHLATDPIAAAAQIVTALQTIVSRNVAPLQTAVVSVTMIHGGEAFNVIPPEVELQGTIRTFEPATRQLVIQRFEQIVSGIASAMGCQVELKIESLTPAVINDAQLSARIREVATKIFPTDEVAGDFRTMGSEDMAFMMRDIPGCYFFIGSANHEKGLDASHHHPRFDVDERALPRGAALMAAAVLELLR
ncbi:MAG: amidohydrolase [Anaerolineales bacterium]|nr:amidohydrolase [Anaerolineales bacterium]